MDNIGSHGQAPIFNHTMLRVRDPVKSRHFYETLLGMSQIVQLDFEDMKFSLHFLAFDVPDSIKTASFEDRKKYAFSRAGVLELTHNWGTESDASFAGYASGNGPEGRGFGHIALSVQDVDSFCAFMESKGVLFKKKPQDGTMKGIAFMLDPDGYWVEVLQNTSV